MIPGDNETVATRRAKGRRGRWYKPVRCSICTSFIWFRSIALQEPVEAPEPRHKWILCKPCHEELLVEMRRSSILSPMRLRIAIGLVAAERSPNAYHLRDLRTFQREFTWVVWFLILFALWHVVIFAILLAVPR